ncbi:MAG: hydroxyethylthiazole kinase [Lachnospiraceae bacterium]|nr:hydroxyethylthiazole kinase [Lachnospiraceae bacterium]
MDGFTGRLTDQIRKDSPLVHCMTNYVTANDCANVLLACGASPIMADDEEEVREITSLCDALVLNLGTPSVKKLNAMLLAGKKAGEMGIPVIFDPVGAGASSFRRSGVKKLLEEVRFSIIKGNVSEIKALVSGFGAEKGVDASNQDKLDEKTNLESLIQLSQILWERTGSVVVMTGVNDLVVSGKSVWMVKNGHSMMGRITGSGCMLSALMGAYSSIAKGEMEKAALAALAAEGVCGQKAGQKAEKRQEGTGSFRVYFMDEISRMSGAELEKEKTIIRLR